MLLLSNTQITMHHTKSSVTHRRFLYYFLFSFYTLPNNRGATWLCTARGCLISRNWEAQIKSKKISLCFPSFFLVCDIRPITHSNGIQQTFQPDNCFVYLLYCNNNNFVALAAAVGVFRSTTTSQVLQSLYIYSQTLCIYKVATEGIQCMGQYIEWPGVELSGSVVDGTSWDIVACTTWRVLVVGVQLLCTG